MERRPNCASGSWPAPGRPAGLLLPHDLRCSNRLAGQRLILRRPSPTDRRGHIVSLTAEGRRFFRAMARENADWIGQIFADLSPEDIETLMGALARTKTSARKAIGRGVA